MISVYRNADVESEEQSYKKKVWRWRSRKVGSKIHENKNLMIRTKINIYWPLLICSEYNFRYIQNLRGQFWIGNISFILNTTTSLNQHSWIFSRYALYKEVIIFINKKIPFSWNQITRLNSCYFFPLQWIFNDIAQTYSSSVSLYVSMDVS